MSIPVEDEKIIFADTLLTAIVEVMSTVGTMDAEQENLIEFGCYFYRIIPFILELKMSPNTPPNATAILQSLSSNVNIAHDLVKNYKTGEKSSLPESKSKNTGQELKKVVQNLGHDLSLIPSSTFQNQQYVEIAVRSLSREMKNVGFNASEDPSIESPKRSIESPKPKSDDGNDIILLGEFLEGKLTENIEPLYDTFFCPLTKKIMQEPVTIESGITYERRAIIDWFDKFNDDAQTIFCPTTGTKIKNRALNSNIALKETIEEWKERNETARIKVAYNALKLAKSEAVVLDAIRELQLLCRKRSHNKMKIHNVGITMLLTKFLEYKDRKLRCETLDFLCVLAEDENGKEIISQTKAIPTAVKMLSSNHLPIRHASVSFLLELSKSEILCENIGSVTGGILMLVTMKYNKSSDPFASNKSGEILKNLGACKKNIKLMAENGHLEPLLNHLIDGSEEMQREVVRYLSELNIGNNMKTHVADRASKSLIKMISKGDNLTRKGAFKALVHISSHHPNNKPLIDAGVASIIIEELFTQPFSNKPMDSKEESVAILANILESGIYPSTMASDSVILNIIRMLKYSTTDALSLNLVKILLSLTKVEKLFSTILSKIEEAETSLIIINFLNSPHDELITVSAELLITFSSQMGYTIAEGFSKTGGQLEGIISNLETNIITKKHAMTTNLLAKLPHKNLALNICLCSRGTVPIVLERVNEIQRGGARTSKYTKTYLEGLVGILVRFTATLYDHNILQMVKEQNLVSVFTELLIRASGSCEVQRLSAVGLERLSLESINLSRTITETKRPRVKSMTLFLMCFGSFARKESKARLCPVHRSECSRCRNFCLLEARAVERLLGCLDNENDEVIEAALAAISTLLGENVNVEGGIEVLNEMKGMEQVLKLLSEHRSLGVVNKSLSVIERILVGGEQTSATVISGDKELPFALVNALHQGSCSTRKVAENILKKLNGVPEFSSSLF